MNIRTTTGACMTAHGTAPRMVTMGHTSTSQLHPPSIADSHLHLLELLQRDGLQRKDLRLAKDLGQVALLRNYKAGFGEDFGTDGRLLKES